jgi:hypothetical protein
MKVSSLSLSQFFSDLFLFICKQMQMF